MATGQDTTPVSDFTCEENDDDYDYSVKSVGNSSTMPRDLVNNDDVRAAFYMLGESVSERMRDGGFEATTLEISVRDNALLSFTRQIKLPRPTNLTSEMVPLAMELFMKNYHWYKPIRGLGIRGSGIVPEGSVYQLNLFEDEDRRNKMVELERCVDRLRGRFGHYIIQRGVLMKEKFKGANANNDIGDAQPFFQY
jgi:DNA polymerase-4